MCRQHVEYCAHCTQCYSNKCCFQLDMLLCICYRNVYDIDNNTSGVEEQFSSLLLLTISM